MESHVGETQGQVQLEALCDSNPSPPIHEYSLLYDVNIIVCRPQWRIDKDGLSILTPRNFPCKNEKRSQALIIARYSAFDAEMDCGASKMPGSQFVLQSQIMDIWISRLKDAEWIVGIGCVCLHTSLQILAVGGRTMH